MVKVELVAKIGFWIQDQDGKLNCTRNDSGIGYCDLNCPLKK